MPMERLRSLLNAELSTQRCRTGIVVRLIAEVRGYFVSNPSKSGRA